MSLRKKLAFLLPLLGVLFTLPSQAQPACVNFGPPPALGTLYGAPAAQVSGDLAFTESLVNVYVYNFKTLSGITFNRAQIVLPPVAFSAGQSIRTTNIALLFDFSGVGFNVKRVTLYYLDLGGYENLKVNASNVYVGELTSVPPFLAGNSVTVTSSPTPPPVHGKTGTVVVTGASLTSLLIGGQELWIDKVCAQ